MAKVIASKEEMERRLRICAECPHLRLHQRCGKCGCKLSLKARLQVLHCPERRW